MQLEDEVVDVPLGFEEAEELGDDVLQHYLRRFHMCVVNQQFDGVNELL